MIAVFQDELRAVQKIVVTTGRVAGKVSRQEADPVPGQMAGQPSRPSEVRFFPEGSEISRAWTFWEIGPPTLKQKDVIVYQSRRFEVQSVGDWSNHADEEGFTQYFTIEERIAS